MEISHIKDVFKSYLNQPDVGYAMLINGPWGTGKTFFWKNELSQLVVACEKEFIYIAVNGLHDIQQLEHVLFLRLLPVLGKVNNKELKTLGKILSNVANIATKQFFKTSISDLFKGVGVDVVDSSKFLLVIDDLERSKIPIAELLGYLNNFVEHRNTRILFLADETRFSSDDAYGGIKEKLIGRTLNFAYSTDEILPKLMDRFNQNQEFVVFMEQHFEYINGILNEFAQQNLRIISFFLDILYQLYPHINTAKLDTVKEILFFSAVITFELKNGSLSAADANDINKIDKAPDIIYTTILHEMYGEKADQELPVTYADEFGLRYLKNRTDEYCFYQSIYQFVLSGFLDERQLGDEILIREPEVKPQKHAFDRLLRHSFRELSNEEFVNLVERVKDFAFKGEYDIYRYADIASFYFYFANNGMILLTNQEIHDFISSGLHKAIQRREIHEGELTHLLSHRNPNAEVERIKQEIKSLHHAIKRERKGQRSDELMQALHAEDIKKIEELFADEKTVDELLVYIDNPAFTDAVLAASNKAIYKLTKLMNALFSIYRDREIIFAEKNLLELFAKKLEIYFASGESSQPRLLNLQELDKTIQEQLTKIKMQA